MIPTRDSARVLPACLASLRQQSVAVETIVVDQESRDGTAEVAASAGAAVLSTPRSRLYAPPTKSRNVGASIAQGAFLLHLDADMSVAPDAIRSAVRGCSADGVVALVLEEIDTVEGYWAKCKALERRAYRGSQLLEAARFVRREVFEAVGGYDETLGSGEDWDVHLRYAKKGGIERLPGAIFHDLGTLSWQAQVTKKFNYGRSTANFREKHGVEEYSREMVASYARNRRLFAADPIHALGFVALRLSEAAAVAAGLAAGAFARRA